MLSLKLKQTSGKLPTSEYELFDGELMTGKIQIRHAPSYGIGIPERMASHIYYEILPEYRRKGYGKQILALGLTEAEKIGLKEISITCMEDNLGSKRIIEHNGGVFIDAAFISTEDQNMLLYRIPLRNTNQVM